MEHTQEAVLIDVRSRGEYAGMHIAGSRNVPLDHLEGRALETAGRVRGPLVVICAQGVRSEQAARALTAAGAPDVRVGEGGMAAWAAQGGDVVRGHGSWAMERQVRLVAGTLVLTGVLASVVRPRAKWLAAGIGGGLTLSAVTNTCTMARVLGYLPYNRRAPGFDLDATLAEMENGHAPASR